MGNLIMGIVLALIVGMVLLGGIKRIGQVTEKLVPFMALFYIALALGVVILNFDQVPHCLLYTSAAEFIGSGVLVPQSGDFVLD